MKIAIVGAGAMGSLFGAKLASTGNDVLLVDVWREAVEAIQSHGLRVDDLGGGTATVRVRAVTDAAEAGPVELVVIFVKCYDTDAAARGAVPLLGPATPVLTLQNGWGNVPRIAQVVGQERVLAGVTYHSATVLGPGHIQYAGRGPTILGELDGKISPRVKEIADVFNAAGLQVTPTAEVVKEIWSKLAMAVCGLPTSALLRFHSGDLIRSEGTVHLMRALMGETVAVAKAQGFGLDFEERWATVSGAMTRNPGVKPSMLQDVERRRRTEIDVVNGAVVAAGKQLNIPTPYNETMVWLIRSLEETFQRGEQ